MTCVCVWGGAAGDAEQDASRFGGCDPRVPQCGDSVLRATVWPQELPETCQGPRPRGAPGPFPLPSTLPGPPTWVPENPPRRDSGALGTSPPK